MKILFFSDAHGDAACLKIILEKINLHQPDQLAFLGDALYHGPRNIIKKEYCPKEAIPLFNSLKTKILAVRGNCDGEVDQMMLEFPMLGDYILISANLQTFFLTHGHVWNENHLPPLSNITILAHGHTHTPVLKRLPNNLIVLNPGSVSLPKGGFPASYAIADKNAINIHELISDKILFSMNL
ncbi:MAG: phosphodiesterase [Lentisphaeria bacterium]